jgi:CRISPR-associated RAMP protein
MTIYRYELTIPVRVVSALHSGGVDEVPERPITDEDDRTVQPNAFVRNGLGEAILPGRSIKGAIRAAFEEHMAELDFRKEELKSLWGGEMRQDVGTGKESLPLRASALTFHHAVVWDRASGDLPHRMSTAIDRATGGAADGALFAYEYLPVDTTFEIRVSAEAQDPAPGSTKNKDAQSTAQREETKGTPPASLALVEKALDAVVTLIHSKLINLGGRTGSGWGRIELGHDEVRRVQVAIPAPVAKAGKPTNPIDQLLNPPRSKTLEETASSSSFLSASTSLEIEWQAPSGLFVGMNRPNDLRPSGEDTIAAAPLRNWHLDDKHRADHGDATYPKVAHEDKASLLLPGTSIRGALRSHCSRIARSIVSDSESSDELTMPGDVHKQLAADPLLVRYLFGTTEYRGAVRVRDCEGRIPEEAGKDKPLKLTRNAIDRVTGSAAHGALYSELLYPHAKWDPIVIEIDHAQLCRNIYQDPGDCTLPSVPSSDQECKHPAIKNRLRAAILLLTMAVTDLCEGVLSLGGGTGGGLGFIDVSRVSFTGLPDATSPVEVPDHSEDSHKVCEARTDFARNILTSVISAFGEKCPEATSAEHTAINLIRKWAGSESDGIQVSSVSQRIRPTQVRISWYSPTGVFVHDPQSDDGNTQHPLRVKTAGKSTKDSTAPLLIPGTSIRGALRARCSRIARTVLYAKSGPPEEKSFVAADEKGNHRPIDIHEQLARDPNLVRYMFGTTEYRGAIRIKDCITTELGSYLKVTHNAIDRWTGGVVEGLLFNEVIYPHATWNDIVIEVDTARLLQNVKTESGIGGLSLDECLPFARASWCLLCIALAELSASTLPLGGRTTRGHGQVEVTSISVFGADGRVVNTPAEPILWKRNGSSEDDARGGATALLAYLRNKTEEQPSYEGWADHLQKLEDPTNEASDSNESNKQ